MIKSLMILSIILGSTGFNTLSNNIDQAIIRSENSKSHSVEAAEYKDIKLPDIVIPPTVKDNSPKEYINARHYLLGDANTGTILVKNDADAQVPIASTTKIMTATIALENYKPDDIVTISEKASVQIGADAYLVPGEKITVESLLNCLLIKSGNDAAYALAEHMSKDENSGVDQFVQKMNEKAKLLGMKNTEYHDPAGLDTSGYSSAKDLFTITRYALKNELFRSIVVKDKESVKSADGKTWHELNNSNRLVNEYDYPGAIGVKTGYMPEAGHCLVGAATRQGNTLIAIILNTYADTATASADEARKLLDYGFLYTNW